MELYVSLQSDIGCKRRSNQDSAAAMTASTPIGNVFFGAVCDGMGGYAEGEVASATVVSRLADWFRHRLPFVLFNTSSAERIIDTVIGQWEHLVSGCGEDIAAYGRERGIRLGTTCTCLLLAPMWYCFYHIGDTRIYYVHKDSVMVITEDQTVAARELREGKITPAELRTHPKSHVLTQGVGMTKLLVPQISYGGMASDSVFVICSDGFRNKLDESEFLSYNIKSGPDTEIMFDDLTSRFIAQDIARGETDNLTAVVAKVV